MAEPRFEDVPMQTEQTILDVKDKWFPELEGARIKVVYDLKKRMTNGKIVFARIMRANDLTRYLTIEEAESNEGYDYFVFLDKLIWENCSDEDRIRIGRHELRHTDVDMETERNPWKLRGHEVEDFYDEIDINKDDPRWAERVALMAESLYDPENDSEA